jgi:hypothetical protein
MNYRNQQLGDCSFFRNCAGSAPPAASGTAYSFSGSGSVQAGHCQCSESPADDLWWFWLLLGFLAGRAYDKKK